MRRVVVKSPGRIHFGLINPFGGGLRKYIGAGLAIDEPYTLVEALEYDDIVVEGCRAEEVREKLAMLGADSELLRGRVVIKQCIPKHVGLGSTTQLVLSVLAALSRLNRAEIDLLEVAKKTGLGSFSGVGTYAFLKGGFVVDSGKKSPGSYPRLMLRVDFPEEWYIVVITPPGQGLRDEEEKTVFNRAATTDPSLTWKASYHLFAEMVPAILERDFDGFSRALRDLQSTVGAIFSSVQGGVFANYSLRAIDFLREMGVVGVGQSSWGPTVYGVLDDYAKAREIAEKARKDMAWASLVTRARNTGALIQVLE